MYWMIIQVVVHMSWRASMDATQDSMIDHYYVRGSDGWVMTYHEVKYVFEVKLVF